MVAASTVEQLDRRFAFEPVGMLQLKGKSQGVDVFALMGTTERPSEAAPPAPAVVSTGAG